MGLEIGQAIVLYFTNSFYTVAFTVLHKGIIEWFWLEETLKII